MKLVSYRARGKERFGVVSPDSVGIIDVSARIEGAETLRDVLAQDRLKEVRDVTSGAGPDDALDDVVLALPISAPQKILCAGRNYRAYHEVAERRQLPEYPSIFGRFASSFSAHRQAILKPKAGDELDYEGELVVVMGKAGRHVSKERAFDYVAGYTCMNEGTVRDWMNKGTQNLPAKNFYRSGGLGPFMVTTDEVPDPTRLGIITRRNGRVVQDGSTEQMIFDIPFLFAHISKFTRLEPGDLIATGSPGGSAVESTSPEWLHDGDVIEIEISGIGRLENPIASE